MRSIPGALSPEFHRNSWGSHFTGQSEAAGLIEGEMFVLSNFLLALAKILDIAVTILFWLILIRALISWVNPDPYNPIVEFLLTRVHD